MIVEGILTHLMLHPFSEGQQQKSWIWISETMLTSEKLSQDILDHSMDCWCLVSSTEKSFGLQV